MTVKIGHASRDENLRAHGGKAGDQDGKEVCVRDWYNAQWNVLLRPKSAAVAEKMAAFCEAVCANPHVGYDQYQRNTLRVEARKVGFDAAKITTDCETDCSAFMTVCAEAAGVDMSAAYINGNAPTTWTMREKFTATGAFQALAGSSYTGQTALLRRGDILVRESGHTAMVLSNGVGVMDNIDVLAREVLAGKWGNDPERSKRLTAAGFDPKAVQARVNALLRGF